MPPRSLPLILAGAGRAWMAAAAATPPAMRWCPTPAKCRCPALKHAPRSLKWSLTSMVVSVPGHRLSLSLERMAALLDVLMLLSGARRAPIVVRKSCAWSRAWQKSS